MPSTRRADSVELRRRELGLRMALGAHSSDILRVLVGEGARLAGLGLALGLPIGFGLTRLLAGLLHGISPNDPATYFAAALTLGAVALLASLLPALRASAVEPAIALREE